MRVYRTDRGRGVGKGMLVWCVLVTLGSATLGFTAEAPASSATLLQDGISLLPADVAQRWEAVNREVQGDRAAEYIREGEEVLRNLGRLSASVHGQPPLPGNPAYSVYSGVLNTLVALLDKIELAIVLESADVEQLQKLMEEYKAERSSLAAQTREERQRLLETAGAKIESQLRDPYFREQPYRRAVIADVYFRLAELTYQETRERFLDEQERYLDRLNELSKTNPTAAAALKPPKPDYRRVLSMYQHLVDEFPDTPYGADALYNIAVLTAESDNPSDKASANQYLETLLQLYPTSRYTLNALQRIAEYYFMPPVNNIEKAIRTYERIAREFGDTEYYPDALFMLGWCYYRLNDLPRAVEYFALALDTGYDEQGKAIAVRPVRDLAPEAMKYISICFSVDPREWDGSGVNNFVKWLRSHPQRMNAYGPQLLIALGDIFAGELGRYADAITAYAAFRELFPMDPRAPEAQLRVVNIFRSGQIYDVARAHQEVVVFFDSFNPDSPWWQANPDPAARDRIAPLLEAYLDTLVSEKLAMGIDAKSQEQYEAFERYSRQYLRFWPRGPNAYKIHFTLASVLENNLRRPMDALREYWQVVTAYPDTSRKELASQRIVAIAMEFAKQEKAGTISVSATGEILPPQPPLAAPAAADTAAEPAVVRSPLLHSEELLLAGYENYINFFPGSELTPTMLYQAGSILFEHNWIPESRPFMERLIAAYPEHRTIPDAYTVLLEGYFKSRDLEGVERIAAQIAAAPNVPNELKEAARTRQSVSIYRYALDLVGKEDHLAAAAQFMRVAEVTPQSEHADKSLFAAGQEYAKGNAFAEANRAYLSLVDRYPKSDLAPKALNNVGFILQNELKDLAAAARVFERLANDYPQSDLVQMALANASYNYNQSGDHASAIRVNELYISRFPAAEDASTYLFENAGHYLHLNQEDRASEIYRRFAKQFPDDPRTVQAHYELASYALKMGRRDEAAREFQATVETHSALVGKGLTGSPKHTALALAQLLEWEHQEYSKLQFRLPQANLEAAKKRKVQWRDDLIAKYQKLIQLGQKEGYRSFFAIGRLVDEHAIATAEQELPEIRDINKRLEAMDAVVTEAVALNAAAVANYQTGWRQLQSIIAQLDSVKRAQQAEYDAFSEMVSRLQLDTAAVGVADSLAKLNNLRRLLTELDSARAEARLWADRCAEKVPEVAARDGDFDMRYWVEQLAWRPAERDEYTRMMLQQAWLNNVAGPVAAEVAALYAAALIPILEIPEQAVRWLPVLEKRYEAMVDTLLAHYREQIDLVEGRVRRYTGEYETMLPKGEDGQSREGFFNDEMGGVILEQVDYWNDFSNDLIHAFEVVLDSTSHYDLPVGFADVAKGKILDFVLDQYGRFDAVLQDARERRQRYAARYEETQELQWDDAAFAYDDIIANLRDYSLAFLEEGFRMRQKYNLVGLAGVNILRRLVELKPDQYAAQVGIQALRFRLVSGTDWKVYPVAVPGFASMELDDSAWENATPGNFPSEVSLGVMDTLGAQAIWYFRPPPPKGPEWVSLPAEITGAEGTKLTFTVKGTAPDESRLSLTLTSDNLPLEATFTDLGGGSGEFAWTPNYDQAGSYTANLVLSDGEFAVSGTVAVTVQNRERALEWTEVPKSVEEAEGALVRFTVRGYDPEYLGGLSIAYSSPNLPATARFTDNGDGSGDFEWQTDAESAGAYTANFTLSNGKSTVETSVPITIGAVNRPPIWVETPPAVSVQAGEAVTLQFTAADPDGDIITLRLQSGSFPASVVFTDQGGGKGVIQWTTAIGDAGEYTGTVSASDGQAEISAEAKVTVTPPPPVNQAPYWDVVPAGVTARIGELVELALTATDPEGGALTITYTAPTLTAPLEFTDGGDGTCTFKWTPAPEDVGVHRVAFTASDGEWQVTAEVEITVLGE